MLLSMYNFYQSISIERIWGPWGYSTDTRTYTWILSDSQITIFSPLSTPWVADEPSIFRTSVRSISDNHHLVIHLSSTLISINNSTCMKLHHDWTSINTHYHWLLSYSCSKLIIIIPGYSYISLNYFMIG